VRRQFRGQPQRLLLCLRDDKLDEDQKWAEDFMPVWNQVREVVLGPEPTSIDGIAECLATQGAITLKDNYEAAQAAKDLVFSILGWQTMLYKPDFVSYSAGYGIVDELDGYHGEARICHNQFALASAQDMPNFLLGFGMMLSPRNYCGMEGADDRALFNQTKTARSGDMDAYTLTKVCGVRVQWVDSLSCHLELDSSSGTLFVFRYPSFCLASLRQQRRKDASKSVLHSCGLERPGSIPWATEEDITELLREILLSYRLIFGQNKRSRAVFRRLRPFAGVSKEEEDPFLSQLCGRKRPDYPGDITLVEREEYDLAGDFPHLRSKIVRIHGYASSRKPRSLRQLWMDKRDSTAWLALWSVLIFGSLSILLALIQAVFQILQYVDGIRNSG